ncbi:MAG: dTMP kinase [Betaproteobacteria bacterium]|nr:dTMP kinase [Betaproteobacteria bacterium]
MAGKFITLEGIDGAGKSSHLKFIADHIETLGHATHTTREPGGTPLGEKLRTLLLNEKMHGDTEALLMFASRREQLLEVIAPLLQKGTWVVCDRFTDSTYAYQCGGRGLSEVRVATLEEWVHGDLQPDLTFLFDAPLDVARERLEKGTAHPDKFEREQNEFFANVRGAYLQRAARFPGRIKVVDSARGLVEIQAELASYLALLASQAAA